MFILFRTIIIQFIFIFITVVIASITIPFGLLGFQNIVHHMNAFWGKCLVFFAMSRVVVIEGVEKIYKDGAVIVVSNHQSQFDIPVLYAFLDIQFRWMAKASLFKIPFLGHAMKGAGYISVDREDKNNAKSSLFAAAEMIKKGASVIIFPEGTTQGKKDGEMLPFKNGSFLLAKKAGVPILPITIIGSNEVIPDQNDKFIQRIYPSTVKVVVHELITAEEIAGMKAEAISQKVRLVIESALH